MTASGLVIWFTGLPSSGKSTLAELAAKALRELDVPVAVLDGDAVRSSLVPPLGYSAADRANFYESLARLAALLANQGLIVLVPATANRRVFRERARALAPAFMEVWIDTPLDVCRARDSKKLYARSDRGDQSDVPGASEPYEAPAEPDFVSHGADDSKTVIELRDEVVRRCRY